MAYHKWEYDNLTVEAPSPSSAGEAFHNRRPIDDKLARSIVTQGPSITCTWTLTVASDPEPLHLRIDLPVAKARDLARWLLDVTDEGA